jgi:PAS domain S-box-containing protein
MFARRAKLGLSRKIVAYYLLFSVAGICWLTAGALVIARSVTDQRSSSVCLTRIDGVAAVLEIQLQRDQSVALEPTIDDLRTECGASWCAVIGFDGKILAHTSPELVGMMPEEPPGDRTELGVATRVAYQTPDRTKIHEYRRPLSSSARHLGELRVAVEQPTWWSTARVASELAPLAVLAPLTLVLVGAWMICRVAAPLAAVEEQLQAIARVPLGQDVEATAVRARDAVGVGWNRIVDAMDHLQRSADQGAAASTVEAAAATRSEAMFEAALHRLSEGVVVTDAAGRVEFANQAVAALLGADEDAAALAGASLEERLRQFGGEADCDSLLSPAARRRSTVCEVVRKDEDLERVLRVARLPLGEGDARRHVWSLRDVTQQKLAERSRDRFIDTATHELRTPLTNIKAYAETLATADEIDVELQKSFCNIINSEVTRLARFIDDLLSISSIEVGALTIDRQKVETERMIAEVLAKVEPQMRQKAINFQTSLAPKLPELRLDKDKIVAVIVNILGNAAKYTPQGGRVSLKVKCDEESLRIAVEDTGFGIAADELPKLFEKFFRSDDPRVQAEVGSGLGLSLALEVVRMHGGELTVESELNQGSTFTVLLPLEGDAL